jgi:hypothetical protein
MTGECQVAAVRDPIFSVIALRHPSIAFGRVAVVPIRSLR